MGLGLVQFSYRYINPMLSVCSEGHTDDINPTKPEGITENNSTYTKFRIFRFMFSQNGFNTDPFIIILYNLQKHYSISIYR